MQRVFIVGACRTPIGKMGGALSSLSAKELGTIVISEAIKRSKIPANEIDHVYMGCVLQAGLGQNIARQCAIAAGLEHSVTAETTNIVCASGLNAVNSAARMIQTGDADIVIASGTESMSNAPFLIKKARYGYKMGSPMIDTPLYDSLVYDGLWDEEHQYHMGITSENVAEKWSLSREEIDTFAYNSHMKASKASDNGAFDKEIIPITIKSRKGETIVSRDEGIRPDTTLEKLAALKPSFKPDGMVTAGNSSGVNDGAAAMILISEKKLNELNITPQAEWISGTLAGVDSAYMGIGPIYSTRKLFDKLSITMNDIDLVECNEAFATQSVVVKNELNIPDEKLNINGGAIALGHPIGCSGARILVSLIHALENNNKSTGLATLCIGGGMGCSTLVRRQ